MNPYTKEMIDYPCRFDPVETDYAEVFSSPVSLALWVAYRGHHICDIDTIKSLTAGSIYIEDQILKNPNLTKPEYKEDLKHIICTNLLAGSHHEAAFRNYDLDSYFEFVYPYLIGEKTASIKIITKAKEVIN